MVAPSRTDSGLKLRLRLQDKILHEISAGELSAEIEIGRSSECKWRVPADDTLISSHHALLVWEGKGVVLRDKGSKNGTWFQGRRIEERKLKDGDRVTLGHCVLTVEREKVEEAAKAVAELEILTGSQRRQRKLLQTDRLTLGTAPDSDLLLTDDLVSRNHAVISRKGEDSYWLKAFATTNGTKVNEVPLRADQERLLKNGDRIALAHVEILFRDGSNRQDHRQALRRLAVTALAAVLVVALYFGWRIVQPPAVVALHKARSLKDAGNFAGARAQLDQAISRRGYRDAQINADLLRAQIAKCESSQNTWLVVQADLRKLDWTGAAAQLGQLLTLYNDNDAWGWQEGAQVRKRAHQTKEWLDAYLEAGHPESLTPAEVVACEKRLAQTVSEVTSEKHPDLPDAFQAFGKAVTQRQTYLGELAKSWSILDQSLQRLGEPQLPGDAGEVSAILNKIEATSTDPAASELVRDRALKVSPPLKQLAIAYNQLHELVSFGQAGRFEEGQKLKFDLPPSEDCLVDTNLFEFRSHLENSWNLFKSELPKVANLTRTLAGRLNPRDNESPDLVYWANDQNVGKVFQCDSLDGPFAKRTRKEPVGEYDQALCVEWFYASLHEIVDPRGDDIPEPPFGRLYATLQTVEAAKALVKFFPTPNDKLYWQKGKIKECADAARRVLARRDQIVAQMRQRVQADSDRKALREALIAGGIAWMLMDQPDDSLRQTLVGHFSALRKNVQDLYKEKQRASAPVAERIEIRRKILVLGLPGDPAVQAMWLEAANGSQPGTATN